MSMSLPQLLDAKGVQEHFRLPRSTLYRLMREEAFPSPVKLSARRVAWRLADIEAWIASRPSSANGGAK